MFSQCIPASNKAGTAFDQSFSAVIMEAIANKILATFTLISIFLRFFILSPVRVSNVRELIFSVYSAAIFRTWLRVIPSYNFNRQEVSCAHLPHVRDRGVRHFRLLAAEQSATSRVCFPAPIIINEKLFIYQQSESETTELSTMVLPLCVSCTRQSAGVLFGGVV